MENKEAQKVFQDFVNAYWALADFTISQTPEIINELGDQLERFTEDAKPFPSTLISPERQKEISDFLNDYEQ